MQYNQPYGVVDPNAPYINGDPTIGRAGSIPPAAAFEEPQREIVNLIQDAGFTPSHQDLAQVTRSVRQGVNFLVGQILGGNINTIAVNSPPGVPVLDTYRAGLTLRVLWPGDNTGASTLNVDGLGPRNVVRGNGSATSAQDLRAGMVVELVDDGTKFQIVNFQGFTSSSTNNNTYLINIPYIADSSAVPNSVIALFSPAITSAQLIAGLAILVKLANTFTGPATITVNANPAKAITHPDGSPIANGDAVVGEMLFLTFDGTNFQLMNYQPPERVILTAPRTFYVNAATGSDSNTGIDAAHPFKTIQHAIDVVQTYDLNGYAVTIMVAAGSYGAFTCKPLTGSGTCTLIGDSSTPANVTVTAPTGIACGVAPSAGGYTINGFRFSAPVNTSGLNDAIGILNASGLLLTLWNVEFLYCAESHIYAQTGSQIDIFGSVRISGGAGGDHMTAYLNSLIGIGGPGGEACSCTITTSVNFGGAFAHAVGLSTITAGTYGTPYSIINNAGYVTGRKFSVGAIGTMLTNGSGTGYFPGNIAGYIESGSYYN